VYRVNPRKKEEKINGRILKGDVTPRQNLNYTMRFRLGFSSVMKGFMYPVIKVCGHGIAVAVYL